MTTTPGPLAEEAAKFVEALSEWARGATGGLPLATDSAECRLCPVCQLIGVLRQTRPDAFGHLSDAAASMVAAMRTLIETHNHAPAGNGSGLERINLDADPFADAT